jgi:hypothetical protein
MFAHEINNNPREVNKHCKKCIVRGCCAKLCEKANSLYNNLEKGTWIKIYFNGTMRFNYTICDKKSKTKLGWFDMI